MDSEGGGVATATTPRRLTSQHSTLRETFLASDLAESLNNPNIVSYNNNNNNNDSNGHDNLGNPRPISSLTLGAVLNSTKKSPPPNNVVVRTLLEIIRNDETLNGGASTSSYFAGKKSWKSFKDRLKLKKANSNSNPWPTSSPVPQSDVLPDSRPMRAEAMNTHRYSFQGVDTVLSDERESSLRIGGSFRLSAALEAEREETHQRLPREMSDVNDGDNTVDLESQNNNRNNDEEERVEQPGLVAAENQPARMSLMDLLEETDYHSSVRGPIYRFDDNDEYEKQDALERKETEAKVEEVGKEEHSCCVCMVRHKGAAFIPCGHTFCRKCSRELWVQRGNCPLCNNFILEILDIF